MRIVAGDARGRNLVTPSGNRTRPTSDRVRESIFNMLFSLDATRGAEVIDLYAGCGALGLEALSRGAAKCTFVERDRRAAACIRENLDALGYADRAEVIEADVLDWISDHDDPVDLVLADPPYADEDWPRLLDVVKARYLVAESDSTITDHKRWNVIRDKNYGTTVVTVFSREDTN